MKLPLLPALFCFATLVRAEVSSNAHVRGIMDNFFLVEEAFNQEHGGVQHIFTAVNLHVSFEHRFLRNG